MSASVGVVYLNCCSKASSFKDNPKSFPTCIGLRAEKYAQSVREDVEEKKHDLEAVPAFHQSNTNEGGKVYLYLLSLVSFLLFASFLRQSVLISRRPSTKGRPALDFRPV